MTKVVSISTLQDLSVEKIHDRYSGWFLIDSFRRMGFTVTNKPEGELFVSFEHNHNSLRQFKKKGINPQNCILIRVETDSVYPAQYRPRMNQEYELIFSPGSTRSIQNRLKLLKHPYVYQSSPTSPSSSDSNLIDILAKNLENGIYDFEKWRQRPIVLSMIAANKVSSQGDNNYQLRRDAVRLLGPSILSTYGPLWDKGGFQKLKHRLAVAKFALSSGIKPNMGQIYGNLHWRYANNMGVVKDKHVILQQSKYSLVIENSQRAVTEKLFDCLVNGSLPVYYGPDLSQFDFDEELIYRITDLHQIERMIGGGDNEEIRRKLSKAREFVTSPDFLDEWSAENVMKIIFEEIVKHFNLEKKGV